MSVSYVGDGSSTYAILVENLHPVSATQVGGITRIPTSLITAMSPTYVCHLGDDSPTSDYHFESISPTLVNDVGDIEKPRHLRRKPKIVCRTCEENNLTHLCSVTVGIQKSCGSPKGPSYSEASVVSSHIASPLINTVVPTPR
jgi:hypothetical protein